MESSDQQGLLAMINSLIEQFQQDSPSSAHVDAQDALIAVGDPAVTPLMDAYPTFRIDIRSASVYVLYAIGTPHAIAALLNLLHDPDDDIRSSAAGWLVYTQDAAAIDAAVPVLLEDLNEDSIRQLGAAGDVRAVEPLIAALEALAPSAKTYSRRMSLASALGKLGDPRAIPVLERLVQTDTVKLDAWGMDIAISIAEVAQTALSRIAAGTADQRPDQEM